MFQDHPSITERQGDQEKESPEFQRSLKLNVIAGSLLCIFAGMKVIQITGLILICFLIWKTVRIVPTGGVENEQGHTGQRPQCT